MPESVEQCTTLYLGSVYATLMSVQDALHLRGPQIPHAHLLVQTGAGHESVLEVNINITNFLRMTAKRCHEAAGMYMPHFQQKVVSTLH